MQLTRVGILFVLALITVQSTLVAQQESQKTKAPPTFKEAVASCIVIVRKETDDQLNMKISKFDAYIKPDGMVEYLGNERERFSFRKCLNEKGYPIMPSKNE